jgi:hypothetical protein
MLAAQVSIVFGELQNGGVDRHATPFMSATCRSFHVGDVPYAVHTPSFSVAENAAVVRVGT